jgi:hypothetical protein
VRGVPALSLAMPEGIGRPAAASRSDVLCSAQSKTADPCAERHVGPKAGPGRNDRRLGKALAGFGGTTTAGLATGLGPTQGNWERNVGMYDHTPDGRVSPDRGVREGVAAR